MTMAKASTMGSIMAVVAALEMNMETKAVVTMNPNMTILGEVPNIKMIRKAIRLCKPECSTHTANIKPPSITKLVAFM